MEDKIVLITGSTRGIGKEIALQFLQLGYFVLLNGITEEIEVRHSFENLYEYSNKFEYFKFDVSNRREVQNAIKKILKKYKKIDILVNNAGITKDKSLFKLEDKMWDDVINVNLTGTYNLCKQVVPTMILNRYGRIINISSIIGLTGNFGQTNYAASKSGLIGFSKSLAQEVAKYNITVNTVAPGFIKTDMTKKLSENVIETLKKKIPLGEFGLPQDVANVVLFLAKDESRYITGETISVNGGLYLK